jgi:hypothetical protein
MKKLQQEDASATRHFSKTILIPETKNSFRKTLQYDNTGSSNKVRPQEYQRWYQSGPHRTT